MNRLSIVAIIRDIAVDPKTEMYQALWGLAGFVMAGRLQPLPYPGGQVSGNVERLR